MTSDRSMLLITFAVKIPFSEIRFSYVRSSGPGGQNVNKVNSKAVLHWAPLLSRGLSEAEREFLLSRLRPQLNKDGEIVLTSDRFRDQLRNREDCLEKLKTLLQAALVRPKNRKKTRPTHSSRRKARTAKTLQSRKKAMRRGSGRDD